MSSIETTIENAVARAVEEAVKPLEEKLRALQQFLGMTTAPKKIRGKKRGPKPGSKAKAKTKTVTKPKGDEKQYTGDVIAEIRKASELTQEEFGKQLGVSGQSVFVWESKGKNVIRLRKKSRAALEKLLGGKEGSRLKK